MNGEELRMARETLGLTQLELAELLGITDKALRNSESGRVAVPGERALLIELLQEKAFSSTPHNLLEKHISPLRADGKLAICMCELYRKHRPLIHSYIFIVDGGLDLIRADILTFKIDSHMKIQEKAQFNDIEGWIVSLETSGNVCIRGTSPTRPVKSII